MRVLQYVLIAVAATVAIFPAVSTVRATEIAAIAPRRVEATLYVYFRPNKNYVWVTLGPYPVSQAQQVADELREKGYQIAFSDGSLPPSPPVPLGE